MPDWNELFTDLISRDEGETWRQPHEWLVEKLAGLRKESDIMRALDLGCGIGRHLVFLSEHGWVTHGMDISPNGLIYSRERLLQEGHPIRLAMADMTALPYLSACFDIIISTYVIHHNVIADFRKTVRDMTRLLIPGGMLFLSIPSTRGYRHDKGRQIEPGTVIPDIGPDKGILHHYFDLGEIAREFADYIIREIRLDENAHEEYLSSHWLIWAEKPVEVCV